ncbi:threonine/serine ThrE exporter family protein [Microbacterium sp. A94]
MRSKSSPSTTGRIVLNLRRTRLQRALSVLKKEDSAPPTNAHGAQLVDMLGMLGRMLLAGSQPTNEVAASLRSLAGTYGNSELRIITLPTLVLIEDPLTVPANTSVFDADQPALRLDQVDAIERLMHRAAETQLAPAAVSEEVAQIIRTPPRFGFWASLSGHVLLTVGFGLVLSPTLPALPIYAALGLLVGLLVLLGSRVRTLALVLPVVAAFIATAIAGLIAPELASQSMLSLVTPAIASMLPGLTLTIATVELTNGQIIAGASRLLYGFATLSLLAFGLYMGIVVTGIATPHTATGDRLGAWAPWVGIVFVAVGYYLYSVAPKGSLIWILFALSVAYAGQLLGHLLLGATLSGLVGALIAVPAIYLASHIPRAPQPAVMLTCAYWMMVPGTLGFIGLTETVVGTAGGGNALLQTIGGIFAIAIGMVIGTGISRDTGAVARAWHGGRIR